jgi:hypothetical protein
MSKIGHGWLKHILLDDDDARDSQTRISSSAEFAPKTPQTIKYSIRRHAPNAPIDNVFDQKERHESHQTMIAFKDSSR